jgi:hypothetical protein
MTSFKNPGRARLAPKVFTPKALALMARALTTLALLSLALTAVLLAGCTAAAPTEPVVPTSPAPLATRLAGTWSSLADGTLLTFRGDGTWVRSGLGISDQGRYASKDATVVLTSDRYAFGGATIIASIPDGEHLVVRFALPDGTVSRGSWYEAKRESQAIAGAATPVKASLGLTLQSQGRPLTAAELSTYTRVVLDRAWANGFGIESISGDPGGNYTVLAQADTVSRQVVRDVLTLTSALSVVDWAGLPAAQALAWQKALETTSAPRPAPFRTQPRSVIDGRSVALVQNTSSHNPAQRALVVTLDTRGRKAVAAFTSAHVGGRMGLLVGGTALADPVIESPIMDGRLTMLGLTAQQARGFAILIQSGPVPRTMLRREEHVITN